MLRLSECKTFDKVDFAIAHADTWQLTSADRSAQRWRRRLFG